MIYLSRMLSSTHQNSLCLPPRPVRYFHGIRKISCSHHRGYVVYHPLLALGALWAITTSIAAVGLRGTFLVDTLTRARALDRQHVRGIRAFCGRFRFHAIVHPKTRNQYPLRPYTQQSPLTPQYCCHPSLSPPPPLHCLSAQSFDHPPLTVCITPH